MKAADFKGRSFLSLNDYTKEELTYILNVADFLKKQKKQGEEIHYLNGKTLGMIFQKSSTRTRVSFETGMYYLGGQALFLSSNDLQIGRGEPLCDTARVLGRMLDGIMIRTFAHSDVEELSRYSGIPVINGLTDYLHPCQIMADMETIREHKGKLEGLKLCFIGDGNNMANSLINGCAILGLDVAIACPKDYEPDAKNLEIAMKNSIKSGVKITITDSVEEAIKDADIVYTDVWASMGQEDEKEKRAAIFKDYQINAENLKLAKPDAMVLHCLPAHRGEEITADVLEAHADEIFDEAENRLYAQMAILAVLMADTVEAYRLDSDLRNK